MDDSVFSLPQQHQRLDSKIAAALERISRALRLLLWSASQAYGLSPIQAQFLVYLRHHADARRRVSQLGREFGLTTATVSDAVSSLEAKGLVRREPWQGDRRVSTLRLTAAGEEAAADLSAWADVLRGAVAEFSASEQETVLYFLMGLIEALQRAGIVTVARMCTTCRFFRRNAHIGTRALHHYLLLDKPLPPAALRVDCPEHVPATPGAAPETR